MKRKIVSIMLAAVMAVSLAACGSNQEADSSANAAGAAATTDGGEDEQVAEPSDVAITILNSKVEVQTQFEDMAEEYIKKTGVTVEIYCADTDTTVASQVATKYASNDPYTLTMVDAKDIYSLADDYAYDLSNEEWASHTTLGITVNDKLAGFPVCVEGRGILYNADAIEAITGEKFDPATVKTTEEFKALLDKLVAGGMEQPVGILSEYWSLGAHYAAEIYENQENPDQFVNDLLAGNADLASNAKFNSLMDTFDTLVAYNYAKGSASNAERETTEMMLAEGQIAFMFGGNWDWSEINQYDYSENMGIMPVPQSGVTDASNEKLVGGGSKYFFIDSSDATSDAQRQAALDFLNWMVFDAEGNSFLTEKCALVPAFDNIDSSALDPLSASVKKYADAGMLIDNYNYLPDDHMTVVGQEIMQKYLDEVIDRSELAESITTYFKGATPINH